MGELNVYGRSKTSVRDLKVGMTDLKVWGRQINLKAGMIEIEMQLLVGLRILIVK